MQARARGLPNQSKALSKPAPGTGICASRVRCFLYHRRIMSEAVRANLPEYSVSEIAAALRRTVEDAFPFVRVRGEVSNLKTHSSGHIYFDLKDDKASLNAV